MKTPISGVYALTVGGITYVGSSKNTTQRKIGHVSDFRSGFHRNRQLQKAWDDSGGVHEFEILERVDRHEGETDKQFKWRLRDAERRCIESLGDKAINVIRRVHGPGSRPDVKARWKDPEYSAKFKEAMKRRPPISEETRRRISENSKKNSLHLLKPVVVIWPDGNREEIKGVSEAARRLGISGQLLYSVLAKKTTQFGARKKPRKPQLHGVFVYYAEEAPETPPEAPEVEDGSFVSMARDIHAAVSGTCEATSFTL